MHLKIYGSVQNISTSLFAVNTTLQRVPHQKIALVTSPIIKQALSE